MDGQTWSKIETDCNCGLWKFVSLIVFKIPFRGCNDWLYMYYLGDTFVSHKAVILQIPSQVPWSIEKHLLGIINKMKIDKCDTVPLNHIHPSMNLPAVDQNSSSWVNWAVVDFNNMFKGVLTPWLLRLHSNTYLTVSLLGLASLPWEDNQFALVLLQPLNISLKGFSRSVFPPMINCNTDCGSNFARDTSSLEWKHSVV